MLRRWIEDWRRGRRARSASDLEDWLDSSTTLLALCQGPLRAAEGPADIGVVLDQIDRRLMRFRGEAAAVRSALRQQSSLALRLRNATDSLFVLRNQTCAFLLRWQSLRQIDRANVLAIDSIRSMEESRLQASRTAREVGEALEGLAPELQQLIATWGRAGPM